MTAPKTATLLHLFERDVGADGHRGAGELTASPSAERVAKAIRAGIRPPDRVFDLFLPDELRLASSQFWTPIAVACRAAEWLDELGVTSLVDVGSGAGKFCVVVALAGKCVVTGFEQRGRLVEAGQALASRFGVEDRVAFVEGTLSAVAPPEAVAYYFYNPFAEHLFGEGDHLFEDREFSEARFDEETSAAEALLRDARIGTYALTYNGFGGRVPACYDEVKVDRELPNVLRLWKKVRETAGRGTLR